MSAIAPQKAKDIRKARAENVKVMSHYYPKGWNFPSHLWPDHDFSQMPLRLYIIDGLVQISAAGIMYFDEHDRPLMLPSFAKSPPELRKLVCTQSLICIL